VATRGPSTGGQNKSMPGEMNGTGGRIRTRERYRGRRR